ncbi:alpha/beta hydrolase [Streptomyces specialis]|uniref:alpha/beta hydrolase n=1 Tax=Streptomyces specialis TaxID=498367 RepID=UPI00073EF7CD|nr:alpha/beta hydrolase [Streptomyces specialis]
MITVPQLRDMLPQSFAAEAARWGATAQWAEEAWQLVEDRMLTAEPPPDGGTAGSAQDRLRLLADNFRYTRARCGMIESALTGLAGELADARASLRTALDEAVALGYEVADDGRLSHPAPAAAVASSGIGHRATATRLAERIAAALRRAEESDARYARTLTGLASVPGAPGSPVLPDGRSARANRAWWNGLSAPERDALPLVRPAGAGALDGLPAAARDTANRLLLEAAEAEHEAGGGPWSAGIAALRARWAGTGAEGLPDAFLLAFGTDGPGRAVVAQGDPDTAAHTAILVPGPGSDPARLDEELARGADLWREAARVAPDAGVCVITWLADEAPGEAFVDGLRVAREGAGDVTVIGHGGAAPGPLRDQARLMTGRTGEIDGAALTVPGVPGTAATALSVDEARARARAHSSAVLDLLAVRARVSGGGPGVTRCPSDPGAERLFAVRHPWSVSGVPREELRRAMARLRRGLPSRGWRITADGVRDNRNRSPRLTFTTTRDNAGNGAGGCVLDVTLEGGPDDEPLLAVTLLAGPFRSPQGRSPRGQF